MPHKVLSGVFWLAVAFLRTGDAGAQPVEQPATHVHQAEQRLPIAASGTAWLPAETPMFAWMTSVRGWQFMLHGNAFAQYLYESGSAHRRGQQFGSTNWLMGMASRRLSGGRLGLRGMVSLEPLTIPGCGYPNLLATGEVCKGDSLHDEQHPHDMFMELAAAYDRPLGRELRWQLYAGLAGEPALGPPGFPHRPSAVANPIAPIAHHWLDPTHITFGLVSAGIYTGRWKVETSAFNSREPDDQRVDFDLAPLDSLSGRVTVMPTSRLVLQVSLAHLRESEADVGPQARTDVDRVTASAIYHRPIGDTGLWATTAAYGRNSERALLDDTRYFERTHASLVETTLNIRDRHTYFARAEVAGKPAHDLHAHEFGTAVFTVAKLQGGYVRYLRPRGSFVPGIGVTASASLVPPALAPRYQGRMAPGCGAFVTVRAGRHQSQD